MWPEDPTKYALIKRVIQNPPAEWRRLTYWRSVVKNLSQTYNLLKVARTKNPNNDGYYRRESKNFITYGLLNRTGRPSRAGEKFIKYTENQLKENPDFLNRKNPNPFELEYLFHKLLYESGYKDVFNNLERVLAAVPEINTEDLKSIVSLVAVNNGDATLDAFGGLSKQERATFFEELTNLQKELKEVGGKTKAKAIARSDWLPYVDLISIGALGNQGDGYYRAASLLRAHIVLSTLLTLKKGGEHTAEELYEPFRQNIPEDVFVQSLRADPEIEEQDNGKYRYSPNRKTIEGQEYEEKVRSEIRKIKYDTLDLSEQEQRSKLKVQLRAAEASSIVTVSRDQGRRRLSLVRHVRDSRTSAAVRVYFKDVCQRCGFDGNDEYGVGIAEVDHALDEIAVTQNNRPSNLVVLCPNCHAAKTKGVLKFSDGGGHFTVTNTHTGETKDVPKIDLN